MLVILAIAAIAILACVVLVSIGRGGELTAFPPDVPPLDLPEPGQLTAVDFMALQLPVNLVGYHTASVDETLRRAANAISARDTRIAVLEQRVSELLASRLHARQEVYAAPGAGPRTEHSPDAPAVARELPESGDPVSSSGTAVSWDGTADLRRPPEDPEWRIPPEDAVTAAPESERTETESPADELPADEPAAEPAADDSDTPAAAPVDESSEPGEGADEGPEGVKSGESDLKTGDDEAQGDEKPQGDEEAVRVAQGKDGDERR
ncbi:hypothetical protein [Nonomuraea helvata]|uniref:DivIVA domain-containing protein n=1 Tax=Nonomuraea helvata TaxID=37484 RepID=A0ABV5RQM5_9ACTN